MNAGIYKLITVYVKIMVLVREHIVLTAVTALSKVVDAAPAIDMDATAGLPVEANC